MKKNGLPMYEQICNLCKGKRVLKQCAMLRFHVVYAFYLYYFTFLTITFKTCNNTDAEAKALFPPSEKF